MRWIIGLGTALCALTGVISPAAAAEEAACTLNRYATVEFEIEEDEIRFPATVNGRASELRLDLKSAFNLVSSSFVEAYGLATRQLGAGTRMYFGDERIREYTQSFPLEIGQVRMTTDALIAPEGALTRDDAENVGAVPEDSEVFYIGMGSLGRVDLELDFAAKQMHLYSQDHCEGAVVYWADSYARAPMEKGDFGDSYLVMEIDGRKIHTAIATDAGETWISGIAATEIAGVEMGERDEERYMFMSLTAEGIEVMGVDIPIIPDAGNDCALRAAPFGEVAVSYYRCRNIYPLNLGLDVLQHMHIYFAIGEEVMYFTGADARKESAQ